VILVKGEWCWVLCGVKHGESCLDDGLKRFLF
jgi:hypothetical protein